MKYGLIVVGGGITGLSTALAWLKVNDAREKPVLVLEKQPVVGGCVATFARKGYRFDTVQIIPEISDLLEFFGFNLELKKFEGYYARLFLAEPKTKKSKIIPIPSSIKEFQSSLISSYPEDEARIIRYFDYCKKMHDELNYLKTEPGIIDIFKILFNCRRIIANSGKTYKQYLQFFRFKNPELIEVLDTFSSFSGLSGERCASLLTTCAMVATLEGSYRPNKGFIQFPLGLRKNLEKAGGEVRVNAKVEEFIIPNGQIKGVKLNTGEILFADYVVSTVDTKVTFNQFIGKEKLRKANKRYRQKVENAKMSPSSMAIHLGLDEEIDLKGLGFDCGYNVLTTGYGTFEKIFKAWDNDELLQSDNCFHMAAICPSLKTGGRQNLVIHIVPVAAKKWIELRNMDKEAYKKRKIQVADFYIKKIEEYMIPGLRSHILYTDVATPATYARYIGSPTGSNYDMMPVPSNFGKNRLRTRTPIKNLFVPKFSHGIWPSMQAGLQVVDMMCGGKIMNGNSSYKKSAS